MKNPDGTRLESVSQVSNPGALDPTLCRCAPLGDQHAVVTEGKTIETKSSQIYDELVEGPSLVLFNSPCGSNLLRRRQEYIIISPDLVRHGPSTTMFYSRQGAVSKTGNE